MHFQRFSQHSSFPRMSDAPTSPNPCRIFRVAQLNSLDATYSEIETLRPIRVSNHCKGRVRRLSRVYSNIWIHESCWLFVRPFFCRKMDCPHVRSKYSLSYNPRICALSHLVLIVTSDNLQSLIRIGSTSPSYSHTFRSWSSGLWWSAYGTNLSFS